MLGTGHEHPFFDLGTHRGQPLNQRQKGEVEKQQPVFGVVDDVNELLRKQAWIDGVAHCPDARYAIIQLEMTVRVPG